MGSTVAAVEETAPWGGVVGPCVTGRVAAELLGVSRDEMDRQRRSRRVLAVATTSGRWAYPLAQFHTDAGGAIAVAPGLSAVLGALLEAVDGL